MRRERLFPLAFAVFAVSALALAACGPAAPTEAPLGTEENPIIWVLTPSEDTERVMTSASPIAQYIEDQTGLAIKIVIPTDFTAQVEAMCSGEGHMAAINTFGYVRASARGCLDVALATVRFGSTSYAGQIITRPDTGIESIEDLAGKTFCRVDVGSTSGWVIPSLTLMAAGIDPEKDLADIVDAGGHDAVVIAVYNGDCDAGSTYEDARTRVESEFPDVMDKVNRIWLSPDIPNDNVSFVPDFPADLREQIVTALLSLNDSEEGIEMLKELYSWSGLERADDSFYDGFRQQLEAAGVTAEDLAD